MLNWSWMDNVLYKLLILIQFFELPILTLNCFWKCSTLSDERWTWFSEHYDSSPQSLIDNAWCTLLTCDLCDSDYAGFTARHFHQCIVEHKYSAIGKHFSTAHEDTSLLKESQFRILKKCQGKFDCLIYEMLFIKKRNPSLNTQTDSIRSKLFV